MGINNIDRNKLGGITTHKNITFVYKGSKCVIDKKGNYNIQMNKITDSKIKNEKGFKNLPFIRGYFKLFQMMKLGLDKMPFLKGLLIGYAGFILGFMFFGNADPIHNDTQILKTSLNLFDIFIYSFMFIYLLIVRKYHGLEHKFIHAFEKDLIITTKAVKAQPKEHIRCGGTYLGLIIFVFIITSMILNKEIAMFLLPGIVFEIFFYISRYKNRNKLSAKILSMPGILFQKLSTGNGLTDEQIKPFIEPFKEFVKKIEGE